LRTIYLLSPARCDGARASLVFNDSATFALARRLRAERGAPLGEVFSFLSGLYFRGKLTYAEAFAESPRDILIITTDRGLRPASSRVTIDDLRAFAGVDIGSGDARYIEPLRRDAATADRRLGPELVVLLGSIATGKYVDTLLEIFGSRLVFPETFVGRGDMSRGGVLLRAARSGEALTYIPVLGATRRGHRPPRLQPLPRGV
jgi:hypothetical protein